MANRNVNPIYFGNISYNSTNEDDRWKLIANNDSGAFPSNVSKATSLSQITGASGHAGGKYSAGLRQIDSSTPITVAVRLPKTVRVMNLIQEITSNADYSVFLSGRSDKKYSEIVDWVKVSDSTGERLESESEGWIPDVTKISAIASPLTDVQGALRINGGNLEVNTAITGEVSTYTARGSIGTNSQTRHCRCFPFMASWVKIEIVTGDTTTSVDLSRLFLNDYTEDVNVLNSSEHVPSIEMVYPAAGKDWLPSDTVYATSRIIEKDNDCCHFGFEIYREGDGGSDWTAHTEGTDGAGIYGKSGKDKLLYVAETNKYNLDGTVNENNTRYWKALGDAEPGNINTSFVPELKSSPFNAVLVVPIESADGGTIASMSNIKFYKNAGNQLLLDAKLDTNSQLTVAQTFPDITLPVTKEGRSTATGWVIDLGNSSLLDVDRIDFVNGSTQNKVVTKVELYYISYDAGSAFTATDSVEVINDATHWLTDASYQTDKYEAKIEFCFPRMAFTSDSAQDTTGYQEGSVAELSAEANNEFNPANNGVGRGESNEGDWHKVPDQAGIMLGLSSNEVGGDFPKSSTTGYTLKTVVTETNLDDPSEVAGTKLTLESHKENSIYIRMALPDPYSDGQKYYARAYVWDGRTKSV